MINSNNYAPRVDFKEQTPEVMFKYEKPQRLYAEVFLSPTGETDNEFSRNTTTWD